jgi:hypothetical protein
MTDLELLLCKVNKVTAYHRHGQKIPESALDDLANIQVEIENHEQQFSSEAINVIRNAFKSCGESCSCDIDHVCERCLKINKATIVLDWLSTIVGERK